jgi:endoglucanase
MESAMNARLTLGIALAASLLVAGSAEASGTSAVATGRVAVVAPRIVKVITSGSVIHTAPGTVVTPPDDADTPPTDDTGTPPADDAGDPPADAGDPPADAGDPPADAGDPPADAGDPPADAGDPPADAGDPPADAGDPPADDGAGDPVVDPGVPAYAWEGWSLYVDPTNHGTDQAAIWRNSDPAGASRMDVLAAQPSALWVGDWSGDVTATVDNAMNAAGTDLAVFVAYDIPNRDCGAWSAGGAADDAAYHAFIDDFAAGVGGRDAIVILEPDSLGVVDCLDAAGQADRFDLLAYGVDTLTAAGASVYLDAGDSNWLPAATMAANLIDAGVGGAAGFALDVSHTELAANEIGYANDIRAIVGDQAHFVIDTSRSGTGPNASNEWCNPLGVAAGPLPSLDTGTDGLDAYLWIKPIGESDGSCNGGPVAGDWWPEYADDVLAAGGY